MNRKLRILLVAAFVAAAAAAPRAAHAAPTVSLLDRVPVGTSPALQTPYATWWSDLRAAVTYDGDPTLPWLIEIQDAFSPGGGTVNRVGPPGLVPSNGSFISLSFASSDAHPDLAFATMTDDYVYAIDGRTGECVWKTYLGRTTATTINFPGCTGGVAPEDIQCPNESDGAGYAITEGDPSNPNAYPTAAASSLVFVTTNYASAAAGDDPDFCGTTSGNRVYALRVDTGQPGWVFNTDPASPTPYAGTDTPPYLVDGIPGGVAFDMGWDWCSADSGGRNQLVFGTPDPKTGQPTLFAVSAVDGHLNWSGAGGDLTTLPMPYVGMSKSNCQHVYAATGDRGLFESFGITKEACGSSPVPCLLSSLSLFTATPFNGYWSSWFYDYSSPLYSKLVVADQSTIHVVSDTGSKLSLYCSASAVSAKYPTLGVPLAAERSVWAGASDLAGNGVLLGLEVPSTPPSAPFDCGTSYTTLPLEGTAGFITTDIAPTNARVIYVADQTPGGSSLVVANFTE
ncbi:MAG TPA: hypothetical protein VGI39_19780 [Polyangiaceae bacterium]|jgi:outer membrane protein assembly factor BamB